MDEDLLFPPHLSTEAEAQEALLQVIHHSPESYGHQQSRWTLASLRSSCEWLDLTTDSGLCQLLHRLHIRYKRGRQHLHSPDPNYDAKLEYLATCYQQVLDDPDHFTFLYLDEFSYYRQPTVARAYALRGASQSRAPLSHRTNTRCRAIGAMNARTGQVTYRQAHKTTVAVQRAFYEDIAAAYPQATRIFVAQDNWPNHAHPQVVAPLEVQQSPFWPNTFTNWSTAERFTQPQQPLPIQLIFLPTYAPWTNPIEKLWHWVKREVLHMHRYSDDWQQLKQRVLHFMSQFALGSTDLLRYVGLLSV